MYGMIGRVKNDIHGISVQQEIIKKMEQEIK